MKKAANKDLPAADRLTVQGAREHNLKNIDLTVPKNKLAVFTGVSGSGKSSMAFDTIFAEGQRRYVESLSAYARQFLGQLEKPKYDKITGLAPTISIEQKSSGHNPRSTVGTVTEIHDYLRVLFARIGIQHCYRCDRIVAGQSAEEMVKTLLALPEKTKFILLAPMVINRKGEHLEALDVLRKSGFVRARINGKIVDLSEKISLDKKSKHTIEAVVDRLVVKKGMETRLTDSMETALKFGDGACAIHFPDATGDERSEMILSQRHTCNHCNISYPELTPQSFSFNNPLGMCEECNGLGARLEVDPDKVVPDPNLSLGEGAVKPWANSANGDSSWTQATLASAMKKYGIPSDVPWKKLPAKAKKRILHGENDRLTIHVKSARSEYSMKATFEGVIPQLQRRWRDTQSEKAREYYTGFMTETPCKSCDGHRLRPESSSVKVGTRTISEMGVSPIGDLKSFFEEIKLVGRDAMIAEDAMKEVKARLTFLADVGLDYLTLERRAPTLSGGESQRIRLASQIGTELTGVLYILDEPSIGLHQRDNQRLLGSLQRLRDIGNSVIVVEHDRETIEAADWVVDFGPGAGRHGGEVVAEGSPKDIEKSKASLTGQYLSGKRSIETPKKRRKPSEYRIEILGAEANNLQNIDVAIPQGVLTCVTGVSGAGKSSLINQILYPAAARSINKSRIPVGLHKRIKGLGRIDKVIDIDQSPIGRTSRSNPATYVKLYDHIRSFFSQLPDARALGYLPGRFSFNVKGGRCEKCSGEGLVRVEMHFLADVLVPCELCKGRRFNEATLKIAYKGNNIADILDLTVAEAIELFSNFPQIKQGLATLMEVGLDYIHLGQPSPTLSGGEAQRVKLARELSKRATGRTLYILDEPTTGLHFDDIRKLLAVLNRLVDDGNTVVVIEHNLDVIKTADHIIDLGPEGGAAGGRILAQGTPEEVAKVKESYTGQYLRECL